MAGSVACIVASAASTQLSFGDFLLRDLCSPALPEPDPPPPRNYGFHAFCTSCAISNLCEVVQALVLLLTVARPSPTHPHPLTPSPAQHHPAVFILLFSYRADSPLLPLSAWLLLLGCQVLWIIPSSFFSLCLSYVHCWSPWSGLWWPMYEHWVTLLKHQGYFDLGAPGSVKDMGIQRRDEVRGKDGSAR